jgi:hypothetical protein
MEVRRKAEAIAHKNTAICIAYEYAMPTISIDTAVIELAGRYPDKGWALNTACTALVHVARGEGTVITKEGAVSIGEDDQVLITPHELYAFDGEMKLLFSATPAWTPEQARVVE